MTGAGSRFSYAPQLLSCTRFPRPRRPVSASTPWEGGRAQRQVIRGRGPRPRPRVGAGRPGRRRQQNDEGLVGPRVPVRNLHDPRPRHATAQSNATDAKEVPELTASRPAGIHRRSPATTKCDFTQDPTSQRAPGVRPQSPDRRSRPSYQCRWHLSSNRETVVWSGSWGIRCLGIPLMDPVLGEMPAGPTGGSWSSSHA